MDKSDGYGIFNGMSAQEQLSAIYYDLYSLDLTRIESVKDVDRSTVFDAVMVTRGVGKSRVPYKADPVTEYGQVVYETMKTGVEFSTHPMITKGKYYVCGDAEKYFAHTITPRPNDDRKGAPIVVVDGDDPVAIIKGIGEATAYVVKNAGRGLIEKTIALPERPLDPQFLSPDVPAHLVRLCDLGDFSPLRYALPAIPYDTICATSDYSQNTIESFEHEAMVRHVQVLAACAQPVSRCALSEVLSQTAYRYNL